MPERHVEQSARRGHLDVRSDHRLPSADRGSHRFPKHRVDAGTAVLHFASDANYSTFAAGNCGSVERLHQTWHETLSEDRTRELTTNGLLITAIPAAPSLTPAGSPSFDRRIAASLIYHLQRRTYADHLDAEMRRHWFEPIERATRRARL